MLQILIVMTFSTSCVNDCLQKATVTLAKNMTLSAIMPGWWARDLACFFLFQASAQASMALKLVCISTY